MGRVMATRNRNDGLRKLCDCTRKRWSECDHSWYFNFKWKGHHYRFSLDKELGKPIDSKSKAEEEADRIRTLIRDGKFRADMPAAETLTLTVMMETYRKQYIAVHRPTALKNVEYVINKIMRTPVERPDGQTRAFGDWL